MSNKNPPLQAVKERFGSKQELAKHLSELLEPAPGESKEQLAARLTMSSNAKLLHLEVLAQKIAAFGGREGMVAKIAAAEKKSGDQDYLKALTEKRTLGWLVDRCEMHSKRAKKAS